MNLHILQHARGLDQYGQGTWYRNHYCPGVGDQSEKDCEALAAAGLMKNHGNRALSAGPVFTVTPAGDDYIRKNSPPAPKVSRGRRRYREWIEIADAVGPFGEWLKSGRAS